MVSVKLPPDMDSTPCICGHARWAHEHFRHGTDCGSCGRRLCPWYRASGVPLSAWERFTLRFRSWLS